MQLTAWRTSDPSLRRGQTDFVLQPGIVNDDAEELFGYARCWALACAIRDETGWRFALVTGPTPGGGTVVAHVGIRTPAGLFLDILGPRPDVDVLAQYPHASAVECVTPEYGKGLGAIPANWTAYMYDDSVTHLVRSLANTLIAQVIEL